ncbi:hypothetical protein L227DRAFT_223169 [Lentinus tigrinus ALCF2SS1-6]|uniref:Uncharacterized protein n=1 Tax=Lentinus tigrinus ALCF2SS1-6 TaxID=1328759 RepID=A0A5C2S8V1_9APHY|nr:hypothetical protein L227DRAFT_223169 [Lentinus tigrinus ALCF2SS1-6]
MLVSRVSLLTSHFSLLISHSEEAPTNPSQVELWGGDLDEHEPRKERVPSCIRIRERKRELVENCTTAQRHNGPSGISGCKRKRKCQARVLVPSRSFEFEFEFSCKNLCGM